MGWIFESLWFADFDMAPLMKSPSLIDLYTEYIDPTPTIPNAKLGWCMESK